MDRPDLSELLLLGASHRAALRILFAFATQTAAERSEWDELTAAERSEWDELTADERRYVLLGVITRASTRLPAGERLH
jgi:hypothetical protein